MASRMPRAWSGLRSRRSADRSARHMENGICSLGLVGKRLDSFLRGQDQQIDLSTARLEFHLVHHRKRSISSGADYEALALPGYLFLDRNRGMSELLAESFRGLLPALANPAAVNDDLTFIGNAINFDSTEVKFAEVHGGAPRFTLIISTRTRSGSEVRGCCARVPGRGSARTDFMIGRPCGGDTFRPCRRRPQRILRRPPGSLRICS